MSKKKLKKAPLKEVIFELRWEYGVDPNGFQIDKGFDLAQGKFAYKMEVDFPVYKKLFPDNAPFKVFGSPVNQFWRGELKWPVVQHGQGMIAINDVEKSYEWENGFYPLILSTINKLTESYSESLRFNRMKLHYMDALDIEQGDPMDFVRENLQTEILTKYQAPGTLKGFNVQQGFLLEEGSLMNLSITSGLNNQNTKNSVVWNTVVEKVGRFNREDIQNWLIFAHDHTSQMFKDMLNPNFYASLDS